MGVDEKQRNKISESIGMTNHKTISREKIKAYAQKYLSRGYDKDALKSYLVELGYPEKLVHATIEEVYKMGKKKKFESNHTWKQPIYLGFGVVALFALLIVIVFLILPSEGGNGADFSAPAVKNCGRDTACFVSEAQQCKEATMQKSEDVSIVKYTSSKQCILTKKIVNLDESEPEAVRTLFVGKEMACQYGKGSLSISWVNDFLEGLNECSGELKDSIYELRLAQLELEG